MTDELEAIDDVIDSEGSIDPVTTRDFLWWFRAQRRGPNIVSYIRDELTRYNLETVPDFQSAYIDGLIEVRRCEQEPITSSENVEADGDSPAEPEPPIGDSVPQWIRNEPSYHLSKLKAANRGVESVTQDATLEQIVSIMIRKEYSQLPIMGGTRVVKGMVSWRSIGKNLAWKHECSVSGDVREDHCELPEDASIFDAIRFIEKFDYVLVRRKDGVYSGIITASDLNEQFNLLTEPFLLLGELENTLRNIIAESFTADELMEVRDPQDTAREIHTVRDLTFGEYLRLLENPDRWKQLGMPIDRVSFCKDLDVVRRIRNDVMHFDSDGLLEADVDQLREFTQFVKTVSSLSDRKRGQGNSATSRVVN